MLSARDQAGRGAGIAVFVLGVLLLVGVFYMAYEELVASGSLEGPPPASSSAGLSAGRSAVDQALLVATKGLFLLVMGFIASAIANKGIGLYQAAVHSVDEKG